MSDPTITAIHATLRALAMRQRTISDNVANIQTPGFTAGRVDFEDELRAMLTNAKDPAGLTPTASRSSSPARGDGNNVSLDEETISLVDTNLRYQLMTQAISAKFRLLRTAIKGSG